MRPLADRVRAAIQAKASEVPPEAVPPLRLPARRRWLSPVAAAVGVIVAITVSVVVSGRIGGTEPTSPPISQAARPSASQRWQDEAARWVVSQVSHTVVVSCDPLMCRELRASGFPATSLLELRSGAASPLGSSVIVATARIRSAFGRRLTSVYAPQVLARFGARDGRVAVRVIAPDGEAAYRAAFRADLALRKQSGAEFLAGPRIGESATAFRQVMAGQVDSRLLIIITDLEVVTPLFIVTIDDSGPGAAPGIPLRAATLRTIGPADCSGQSLLTALHQMALPQFRPGQAGIVRRLPGGCAEIRIEFPAPSVLGLLNGGSS